MQYINIILAVLKIIKLAKEHEGEIILDQPVGSTIITKLASLIDLELTGENIEDVQEIIRAVIELKR